MSQRALTGVGIIGGGRWARVLASVLDDVRPDNVEVQAASDHNAASWKDWTTGRSGWSSAPSASKLLGNPEISHVIVARKARDHATTVLDALSKDKAVLVEKPFCLTQSSLQQLLLAAEGKYCATGHVLLFAYNQILFRNACVARGKARKIMIEWADPAGEFRHGERKTYDASLNVLQDVFPHIWSISKPFFPGAPITLDGLSIDGGGRDVQLELSAGDAEMTVKMARDRSKRERLLTVQGDGYTAALDFAREPGTAQIDNTALDVAEGYSSPLAAELTGFLGGQMPDLALLENAAEAIRISVASMLQIRKLQAKELLCSPEPNSKQRQSANYALREVSGGGVAADGQVASADTLADWLDIPKSQVTASLAALISAN